MTDKKLGLTTHLPYEDGVITLSAFPMGTARNLAGVFFVLFYSCQEPRMEDVVDYFDNSLLRYYPESTKSNLLTKINKFTPKCKPPLWRVGQSFCFKVVRTGFLIRHLKMVFTDFLLDVRQ